MNGSFSKDSYKSFLKLNKRGSLFIISYLVIFVLLAAGTALLVCLGLAVLYGTTVGGQGNSSVFIKQLILAGLGFVVVFSVSATDSHSWRSGVPAVYLVAFLLLVSVCLSGHTVNGR